MGACLCVGHGIGSLIELETESRMEWLSTESLGFACLCLPSIGIISICHMLAYSSGFWALNMVLQAHLSMKLSPQLPCNFLCTFLKKYFSL